MTTPKSPPTLPPGCDALLAKAQLGYALGVSRRTLDGMIAAGEFPRPDTVVASAGRWRVGTLNAWIESRCARKKG